MMSRVFGMGRSTANQMCEVHTSSHDITEPNVSSNYENTSKPVTADLTTNYDAETNTSLAVKMVLTTANWIRILTEAT